MKLGGVDVGKFYLGASEVDKIYLGSTQVYPWTPALLGADLALWLDAADADTITLNGSNVSQWDDKSGNGRNVSQAVAAQQPAYDAVNKIITFDGSNDYLFNATVGAA